MTRVLLLAVLALGCGTAATSSCCQRPEPSRIAASYARAVERWHAATGRFPGRMALQEVDGAFLCGPLLDRKIVEGCWSPRERTLKVNGRLPQGQFDLTVLHELGHALGAKHLSSAVPGVMQIAGYSEICITAGDVAAVCDVAGANCPRKKPECP